MKRIFGFLSHCTANHIIRTLLALSILFLSLPMSAVPTQANTLAITELFFSEYVEGTANNKALEIYNGTETNIDLAANDYKIKIYQGGSSSPSTIDLTGVILHDDVFVFAHGNAHPDILAEADQLYEGSDALFTGDDSVALYKGETLIDVIGQVGYDPGVEWGSGLTSTADNTLRRKSSIRSGDTIDYNNFDPLSEWDGYSTDTFDGLGSHTVEVQDDAPSVESVTPVNGATDATLLEDITINFSEPVYVTGSWFDISCEESGIHTAAVSGGPSSYVLNPDTDFIPFELCDVTIFEDQVTDRDTNDPPDAMTANYTWSFVTQALPLDFNKTAPEDGAIDIPIDAALTWEASAGEDRYEYCIDVTDDDTCSTWIDVDGSTSVSPDLTYSTTYYWQVRAVNSYGTTYANGSETDFWSFTIEDPPPPPGAFDKLLPDDASISQPITLTLTWEESTDAEYYEYCFDTFDDDTCDSWINAGTVISASLTSLAYSTTYYWQVRSTNYSGTTYANGDETAYWSFSTLESLPEGFTKISPADGAVSQPITLTLTWSPSIGAGGYEICYDLVDEEPCSIWTDVGAVTETEITGLAYSTTYMWQVRAYNPTGWVEADSDVSWQFTTRNEFSLFLPIIMK